MGRHEPQVDSLDRRFDAVDRRFEAVERRSGGSFALTELITNNAAAELLFLIAVATAAQMGTDPRLRDRGRGVGVVSDADRLPDEPDGVWPGAPLTAAVVLAIVLRTAVG